MGGRAGGGARGGGGGAARGGGDLFTGGFKEGMGPMHYVKIESIDRQTEKAIQVTAKVNWNGGTPKSKQLWFPKSSVKNVNKSMMMGVSSKMFNAKRYEGSFKGYTMNFQTAAGPFN